MLLEEAKRLARLTPDVDLTTAERIVHVSATNRFAAMQYVPQAYSGPITVISAVSGPIDDEAPVETGWETYAGGIERHVVHASHNGLTIAPAAHEVARILTECLDRAAAPPNGRPPRSDPHEQR